MCPLIPVPHHARICFQDALEIKSLLRFLDDLTFWWLRRWVNKRNRERRDQERGGSLLIKDTGTSACVVLFLARYGFARLVTTSVCAELLQPVFKCEVIKTFKCCPEHINVHVYFYLLTTALKAYGCGSLAREVLQAPTCSLYSTLCQFCSNTHCW